MKKRESFSDIMGDESPCTCDGCEHMETCEKAFDIWNIYGYCVMDK